jgi:hypothetical protein
MPIVNRVAARLAASRRHGTVGDMRVVIPFILMLAACGKQASQPANEADALAPAAKPAAPAAKAFTYDEDTNLLEFHYGWSAEAAAVPPLAKRFRAELDRVKAELLTSARADKTERGKQGFPFNGYSSSTEIKTAGQSARLLSLSVDVASFTGGAHGNYGMSGLLWDRQAQREIEVADLFAAPANMDRLLTQPWCDALNNARSAKREEPVGGDSMFDECPKLGEISIIPTDKDGNGKLERLMLVADPYVAGPYAEGDYEIDLPVTPDLIAAIRSEYRESFEVQPQ